MIQLAKFIAHSIPPIRRLVAERQQLRKQQQALKAERTALQDEVRRLSQMLAAGEPKLRIMDHIAQFVEPGHYYSPIPSMEDVRRDESRIFDRRFREIPGIDLNVEGQIELLHQFKRFYGELPFTDERSAELRYYFNNDFFSYSDAIFLYSMIRFSQPKRIIEIGSGFSSFVMLDTNERFFNGGIQLTFVEPNHERLQSRLKPTDLTAARIITQPIQDVELSRFDELEAGDILFVDSSHVSKVGSDVNHILFEILPRLRSGVYVHVHDVFYPFEYLRAWIETGRYWNEDYLLRAFLQYNSAFKIAIWDQFLGMFHAELLEQTMPLCLKNIGGSIWIKRL